MNFKRWFSLGFYFFYLLPEATILCNHGYSQMSIYKQQVRTQQIHEMKKNEKEYMMLQVRSMLFLYSEENIVPKVYMQEKEGISIRQKEGRQRGTWNGKEPMTTSTKRYI